MVHFAEIETTYSVAFDWQNPSKTPQLFNTTKALLAMNNSASQGECDAPLAPALTKWFSGVSQEGDLFRQQGDAVVLAAGGICQVVVPYAADVQSESTPRLE